MAFLLCAVDTSELPQNGQGADVASGGNVDSPPHSLHLTARISCVAAASCACASASRKSSSRTVSVDAAIAFFSPQYGHASASTPGANSSRAPHFTHLN